MSRERLVVLSCSAICAAMAVCPAAVADPPTLKDAFAGKFRIGAAVSTPQIMGQEPAALQLVAKQFNTITPENLLKWAEIHPQPDEYNFAAADRYLKFGEQHQMFIIGHNLVWHNQTPPWVFEDGSGKPLRRDALLRRMRDHIHTVVGRYKGRINGWDVVNEAIDDDGSLRKSKWHDCIGDDYIEHAFQFAHEADPAAELYYNDYNEWQPQKRRAINALVRRLKSKGIRIDGIGLQGHWGLNYPSVREMEAMFDDYGKLGVKLMITELDVTILPDAQHYRGADITRTAALRGELNPFTTGLPPKMQQRLAERYRQIFRVIVAHSDAVDRVTFWGVHDGQSWRNDWPIRGRTDYPLLFNRQLKPKPAFEAVIQTANLNR
ncbi:MAG TPA: endo-1,4-beta-xylanase [Lacipirellulaceae bacterium]|nr:endo-1,4-beta-xylanase [Lacipirellulaceae bacterium]